MIRLIVLMKIKFTLLYGILVVILLACAQNADAPRSITIVTATAPPLPDLPTQVPASTESILIPPTLSRTFAPAQTRCLSNEQEAPIRNVITAELDWNRRRVEVDQTIYVRNEHDAPLDTLVLQVEPNRLESFNVMALYGVYDAANTAIENYVLESTRLTIPLSSPLEPDCETSVRLVFKIQIPNNGDTVGARFGYLGYTWRQVNLGHWLPTPAHYQPNTGEWVTNRKYNIGEQTIPENADYQVTFSVLNPPENLQIAAPGDMRQVDEDTWVFELSQSRDFALSLSTEFGKVTTQIDETTIEVYYFPATQINARAPEHALSAAKEALELYSELFGDYPYTRLVVVEGDFPDGMEFTGLVFVSEAWFKNWNGKTESWLTIITVHEIAHQWWYALVANDQGMNPYLDEALASYSELIYFEHYYPETLDWWWELRVTPYITDTVVDSSVYDFTTVRPYINAVYLRGASMLHDIRQRVGDDLFFAWLKDYTTQNRGRIVLPIDFWGSLSETEYLLIADIRAQYLAQAEILPTATSNVLSQDSASE